MERPTVHDLAKAAKVSLATVDRVLNGRPGVRQATVARVRAAIDQLGYSRDVNAATLARRRPYRFVFLLPASSSQFVRALVAAIGEAGRSALGQRAVVEMVQAAMLGPQDAADAIRLLEGREIDGLAIMAPETPGVRDAVIRMRRAGVEVVPIVADLPGTGRSHFVGIDNRAAGRTAAELLGRFCGAAPGCVAVIAGSPGARDGVERRLGFDQVMAESFPALRVLPTAEGRDDGARVEAIATRLMGAHDDLVGLYATAAGASGLAAAVRDRLARAGRRPFVIAHELTPVTAGALRDRLFDAVISQDVEHIARSALRVLRAGKEGLPISRSQERIRIEIFTRENLPEEDGAAPQGESPA